ncbi:phospholipase D-like domain-containing protein [Dehalococcoides mccartyi]|uniref:Phospholipase D-like domain-containing protein n=1 Tax=Dehalococcoides mccartyi TaxID=61435 RepID=A0A2J1E0E4_9CHLR|nr:phospholipase D-like domain-containing protein [Dehalococcoides mccartyi]PKH47942.1 hypothetical protein CVH13_00130 [Dehalococcoides mccartyi]BAS31154.1 hypothetical protein IBK_0079 [Dehalococcoides mccartyi IBARAKI]
MAEFLTTHAVAYNIENIIINAKELLVLISPYLQLSKTFYERIRDAHNKGVQVVIIYGKDQLKPEEKVQLNSLPNVDIYFCENLHAKCYFNDYSMIITSMNMFEFSEKNNREMGILIQKDTDIVVFNKALGEVKSIIDSSQKIPLTNVTPKKSSRTIDQIESKKSDSAKKPIKMDFNLKTDLGQLFQGALSSILGADKLDAYCIRCKAKIPYDARHPLCDACYPEWASYKNREYKEEFCHKCGKRSKTSYAYPECRDCYKGN